MSYAKGGAYRGWFGAPYFGIHRADLQRVLAGALGHRLVSVSESNRVIRLDFDNGKTSEVDILIGSNGQHSAVRRYILGDKPGIAYSGTSGFRGIVPVEDLRSLPDPRAVQFWMGPNAHLLHFAIGPSGGHVNFLAVVEGPKSWTHEAWTAPVTHDETVAAFEGWHPAVVEMFGAVSHGLRWGLFQVRPLRTWQRGRAILMGDSAHGMLPHHGQGANVTIEDAVTLAELLRTSSVDQIDWVMQRYQALRRGRTRTVQRSAHDTNTVLHLSDGFLEKRAFYLARVPERSSWLHGFDTLADVTSNASSQTLRRVRSL
jgi:salicylate hydroxylase